MICLKTFKKTIMNPRITTREIGIIKTTKLKAPDIDPTSS
jgi:hypothetical protein